MLKAGGLALVMDGDLFREFIQVRELGKIIPGSSYLVGMQAPGSGLHWGDTRGFLKEA